MSKQEKAYISYFKKQLPLRKFRELFPFDDEMFDSQAYGDFILSNMIEKLEYDDNTFTNMKDVEELYYELENALFGEEEFQRSMEYVRSLNIMDYKTFCKENS
nr:hypothetical protein [Clostridia bacterium]